jgi:hypothetical protein
MQELEIVVDEFIRANKPEPKSIIRKSHSNLCLGIQQVGNTAVFCSCFTSKAVQSVIEMHRSWHKDLARRIGNLEARDGMINKQDVLFLISENGKWE